MDSDSTVAIGGDRLSQLDDGTLGDILSFLPADEAARAALLSRRWRHLFAHVHTLSLDEPPAPEPERNDYGCYTPGYGTCRGCTARDRVLHFVNRVSAALIGRLRRGGAAGGVPLRALRVAFDESSSRPNAGVLDMWLLYAMQQAGHELDLDLRLSRSRDEPTVCDRPYSLRHEPPPAVAGTETTIPLAAAAAAAMDDDPDGYVAAAMDEDDDPDGYAAAAMDDDENGYAAAAPRDDDPDGYVAAAAGFMKYDDPDVYVVPRIIFTCATLRTLRLGSCCLDLPSGVALPSLDTLHLTAVTGWNRAVERLVSSCPRLAALTLEACTTVTALSVPPCARLRTLALRCCHYLASVVVAAASELRSFEYRGTVPGPSFLTLHGGPLMVSSCTLFFCGCKALQLSGLEDMLRLFAGVERLQLTSARLGFDATVLLPPVFPKLRHLELTGILPEDDATAIDALARILERTPNLETLSLFFMPEPEPVPENKHYGYGYGEDLLHGHKLKYDERASFAMPDIDLHCLRERVKEINLVHYQGGMAQRMLAKFLLCNAPGVQEVCGEFASGPLFLQIKLMEEIKGWVMNRSANMMFF